jgi:ribosomal RNA methyltransferase Nop2
MNKYKNNKFKKAKKEIDEGVYINKEGEEIDDIIEQESEDEIIEDDNNEVEREGDEYVDDNLELNGDQTSSKNSKKEKTVDTAHLNVDMGEVNLRIQGIVHILSDFNAKKEGNKSRSEYMAELKSLLIIYYDYNKDMMNLVLNLFAPNEAVEFLESNNTQRVQSIRTNTIKAKRRELAKSLIQRGVNLDPLAEWTKVGLKIYDSQVPIGATPEYLSGQYMLQSGSSFLPILALGPLENEKILDMVNYNINNYSLQLLEVKQPILHN